MTTYHLAYERFPFSRDFIVDENGNEIDKKLAKEIFTVYDKGCRFPKYKANYNKSEIICGNRIEQIDSTYSYVYDDRNYKYKVETFCICKYTNLLDINGNPIYEWDYVRTDEIGWCGFAFISSEPVIEENNDLSIYRGTVDIIGTGGISTDPLRMELQMNPILDMCENPPGIIRRTAKYILTVETPFLKRSPVGIKIIDYWKNKLI